MIENTPKIIWMPLKPVEFEGDCGGGGTGACSTADLAVNSWPEVDDDLWQLPPYLYRIPLPDENQLVLNPNGSNTVAVINQPAQTILDSFSQPSLLTDTPSRQFASLGLLRPQGVDPIPLALKPDVLTAWLHVTNACNLRCTYCYVYKTEEAMNEATGRAAVEAVFRSAIQHEFRAVSLKYAGGEAALNFSLIRTLHQHACYLAQETGLQLRETILSNGVMLTREILDYIRNAEMRLMISMDGVGLAHDAQRIFANGRGSFVQVKRGIERAIQQQVPLHLSITVTGQSADRLAEAVAFALDHNLQFNLNFYRDNDYAQNRAILLAEDERLIAGIRAAFAVIEARLPQQSLIASMIDRSNFGGQHLHTCGVGHNYLVIDQRGRVARCHMEIERIITDVFTQDPLAIIRNVPHGFQNIPVDEKEGCRECSWRYWCAGGCPLLTYRVTGRSDVKSPYCTVYKTLYPELLRLEGLRLLKWYGQSNLASIL